MELHAPKPHKLLFLDALRGIAACMVIVFHERTHMGLPTCPHGYLAVDFFFMLSGFVLSLAYQRKLDEGWSTLQFLKARWIRLYPLYLVGLLLGVGAAVFTGTPAIGARGLVKAAMNLCVLPARISVHTGSSPAFPYNVAAWSLFFEAVANIVHAAFLRRRSTWLLGAIACGVGCAVAGSALRLGTLDGGALNGDFLLGLFRVLFSYIAGMVLFRLWRTRQLRILIWPVAIAMILVASFFAPAKAGVIYDLGIVFLLFPVLLLAGADATFSHRSAVLVSKKLGEASYAVYITHEPLLKFLRVGLDLSKEASRSYPPWMGLLTICAIFAMALGLDHLYDFPIRKWLTSRLTA